MTRLSDENIASVNKRISLLEETYRLVTGKSMVELGCYASGVSCPPLSELRRTRVACIPVTSGKGIITDFSQTVARILEEYAEVDSFVTGTTDVAGIHEAIIRKADMIFMADDDRCLCRNLNTGAWSDNGYATGRGFGALLYLSTDTLSCADILVLGAGKVGIGAYRFLDGKGVMPFWYDRNHNLCDRLDGLTFSPGWSEKSWDVIIDATPAPCYIEAEHIKSGGIIAAPGVPFGITDSAVEKAGLVFSDELETGIVTMFGEGMRYGRK